MLNLKDFINKNQLATLRRLTVGEEGSFFIEKIKELKTTISQMPKTYETEEEEDPTAYLHYFSGGNDWWITERDSETEQLQAFGIACLNQDGQMAELGYINIKEIIDHHRNIEIDLYYTPKTVSEIMAKLKR